MNRRCLDYDIIKGDPSDIIKQVEAFLKYGSGWEPVGAPVFVLNPKVSNDGLIQENKIVVYQAMARYV